MSLSLSSTKIFPSTGINGLDADETAQIAKLGAIIAPSFNHKPTFKSSLSKKGKMDSGKSNGSDPSRKFMSSFLSTNSEMDDDDGTSLEIVINFLTSNIDNMLKDRMYMKEFEELCHEMMKNSRDPELHRIVKSHGWTGTRYKDTSIQPLDMHALLQDLSNLYLRYKVSVYATHISSLYESGNAKATDQIFSFVPDTLLTYLAQQKEAGLDSKGGSPRVPGISPKHTSGAPAFSFDNTEGTHAPTPETAPTTGVTSQVGSTETANKPPAEADGRTTQDEARAPNGQAHRPSSSSGPHKPVLGPSPKHSLTTEAALAAAEVRSITFTGACMLADISGFSKFSGAMCLKGVSGLDELREATNGFLGHIVKTVYEFNGDGKSVCCALLCLWCDAFTQMSRCNVSYLCSPRLSADYSSSHRCVFLLLFLLSDRVRR
jgi:hypothetical protein